MKPPKSDSSIRSTCPYCGVGCGVLLSMGEDGEMDVRGDPDHPANFGRLCSKGSALGETVSFEDRLLVPRVYGEDADWDTALDLVATTFQKTIAEHGPDSVAFYVSGQLLTEDYYIANKLMKGFMGSANIDTNSRLCMASTVAGHKRAFGTDTVPGTYEDLEEADLIVLTGSNLAWCHPVLYQRILATRKARPEQKLVVIDPRRTASCDLADLHLPLNLGSDVALFNGLLAEIEKRGLIDRGFEENISGLDDALATARTDDLSVTGLSDEVLTEFYDLWCGTEKTVTIFSQGVNQSSSGTDKVNAITNCHLATGRIGRVGLGPFSVTGQPNAMGGREVGGLANMLACHLDLENADHRIAVKDFWSAPEMPEAAGLKAVEMFKAVGEGKIKALWILHTNPAVSMPDADRVRDAIAGCDFVVVSDITASTDTARLAHVLLPATGWGEKDGTVTNSDRMMSRQRIVLPAPGEARPDWDQLADVGRRMGWKAAFDFESPAEIFREYAALSGIAGGFGRDFDISGLSDLTDTEYSNLVPTRWPVSNGKTGGRFFADGKFFTPDGKGRMLSVSWRPPVAKTEKRYPFRLNTGRIRDQWHTMTRTARSPRLSAHLAEPFLEIHPDDAAANGIGPTSLVEVQNPSGTAILRAMITDRIAKGEIFAPMHWTGENAPTARVDALVPSITDPVSGQPESKGAVAAIKPFAAEWYGFAISQMPIKPACDYWALAKTYAGYRVELAGLKTPENWVDEARELFGLPEADVQTMLDPAKGTARIAFHQNGALVAALFISREPVAVMRDYLAATPGQVVPMVLAGKSPSDQPDPGPVLCSCFNVGINTILAAIETRGMMSVEAIGEALDAGTNCGSCRPEIAALIAQAQKHAQGKEAAE